MLEAFKKKKKRLENNQMKEEKADVNFASKNKNLSGERQGSIKDLGALG